MIDFRSDALAIQPQSMIQAMSSASTGLDENQEDPSVNELEEKAARLLGKPAALFVPTETMGNQLAILCRAPRATSVLTGSRTRYYNEETGGAALLSGVHTRAPGNPDGRIYPHDIEMMANGASMLIIENTQCDGTVLSMELMKADYAAAKEMGLFVHLDGTRLFSAAQALQCPAEEIAHFSDSVVISLSHGLCAPSGAVLAGSREMIQQARDYRTSLAGAFHQIGYLAKAGTYALENMIGQLRVDHDNACLLGRCLQKIPGIELDLQAIETNMVFFTIVQPNYDPKALQKYLTSCGIGLTVHRQGPLCAMTHYGITGQDCQYTADCLETYLSQRSSKKRHI